MSNNTLTLHVPKGKYLTDINPKLPAFCILDAQTGIGKTTFATSQEGKVIIAMSTIIAIQQQAIKHPNAGVWYGDKKTIGNGQLIFVTYDNFSNLIKNLVKNGYNPNEYKIFVDEYHNFGIANFRIKVLRNLINSLVSHDFMSVCFMSGTPLKVKHSYLDNFVYVKVVSHTRIQQAHIVNWKEEYTNKKGEKAYRGSKKETVVALLKDSKRAIILFNNKGDGLHNVIAWLEVAGKKGIYFLNADNKYQKVGQQIVIYETLPDDCKVLIVTSVLCESANLKTHFDTGIIMSRCHPAMAQQFANRIRGDKAVDKMYILNTGRGNGYQFDYEQELEHCLETAKATALLANQHEKSARLRNDDLRHCLGLNYGSFVTWNNDNEQYVIDEIGIAQYVQKSAMEYCANNPRALKQWLGTNYRWSWGKNINGASIVTKDKAKDAKAKEIANEHIEQDKQAYIKEIAKQAKGTPDMCQKAIGFDLAPKETRIATRLLELYDLTKNWQLSACLLAQCNDTTKSYHKLKDTLIIAKKAHSHEIVEKVYNTFEIGKTYSVEQRIKLLRDVYESIPYTKPFVGDVMRYSWSQEPVSRLNDKTVNRVLSLMFTYEGDVEDRYKESGERKQYRVMRLTSRQPLLELLNNGIELLKPLLELDCHSLRADVVCDGEVSIKKVKTSLSQEREEYKQSALIV